MTKNKLATRALGVGFAAALVLGGAACGDDDVDTDDTGAETDDGIETGGGLGGTEDDGEGDDSGVVDGMGGTDDAEEGEDTGVVDGMGGTDDEDDS